MQLSVSSAIVISLVSAAAAVAAAVWARESARAAQRSATATERAADAQEHAVETARAALALDRERAAPERYRAIAEIAPTMELVSKGGAHLVLVESGRMRAEVMNMGPGDAIVESAVIRNLSVEYIGLTGPVEVAPRTAVRVEFHDNAMVHEARSGDSLVLIVQYRDARSSYRARAMWRVLRDGSDVEGRPKWQARPENVERLDRPDEA